MICAICGSDFDPALSAARPFCSDRCRQIDLSRWLDEGYGVPWDASSANEENPDMRDSDSDGSESGDVN